MFRNISWKIMFFHFQKQALRRKSCPMPASLEFGAAGAAAIPSRKMGLPIDPLRTRSIIFAKCAAEVCFSRLLFGSRKRPIGETGISWCWTGWWMSCLWTIQRRVCCLMLALREAAFGRFLIKKAQRSCRIFGNGTSARFCLPVYALIIVLLTESRCAAHVEA